MRRTTAISPLLLLLVPLILSVLLLVTVWGQFSGPITIVPTDQSQTVKRWRPVVEHRNLRTRFPIDTAAGGFADLQFEPASNYLALPTSALEDEQCLHPDVLYVPEGFGGHKWWMVMTPFPATDSATYELPDILCSDDGNTWAAPAGLTNPISPIPAGRYLSDTSLLLDNGILYCFYRDGKAANPEHLQCKTSTDGVTWSAQHTVISSATVNTLVAPIVRNLRGTYYLWTVDLTAGVDLGVLTRRSAAGPLGPYGTPTNCTINGTGPTGDEKIWHGNLLESNGRLLFIATFKPYFDLFAGVSDDDGLTFNVQEIYATPNTRGSWDDDQTYQAALVQSEPNGYDVFYGGKDGTSHFIGRGKVLVKPHPRLNRSPLVAMQNILGTECVGFWPFLTSSGTTIADGGAQAAANLHNLTASSDFGRWATAPVMRNPVYYFTLNGSSEGASVADHADFSMISGGNDIAFSTGAWVWIANTAAERTILGKYSSVADKEWRLAVDATEKPGLMCHDHSGGVDAYEWRFADAAISTGAWHFVVATRDATQGDGCSSGFLIYVDGAVVASTATNGAGAYVDMEDLAAPLTLGYVDVGGAGYGWFNQRMALPFLTRKQLTAWDVRMLYEHGKLLLGL